ncbi:MAG: reverse transcriptase domain-containing protein [Polyangiales bacterium]
MKANKGSPGVDGMTVDQLPTHLRAHWPRLREDLLAGRYQPQPVRRCEIPKATGGTRMLGIPTAVDQFIQQAILQVLQPRFDPTFSPHSYGFRPGRSAHDAILAAQRYVADGRVVVVDVDLEKFFDRVHHDVLMGRLARRIEDKRLLGLIRRYLEAGMMADGVATGGRGRRRRPAVTAAGQRAVGRGGQGVGAPRSRVRALRRRLQRVRAVAEGGRACDELPSGETRRCACV